MLANRLAPENPGRLRARAEAAANAGDAASALDLWRKLNATSSATAATHLAEAKASLTLGKAAQARLALGRATRALPTDPEAWILWLEILQVLDRPIEASRLGWEALEVLDEEARTAVLKEMTLAALTEVPDELARITLRRWIEADPEDVDARVALLRRAAIEPRADDPDREARLQDLRRIRAGAPSNPAASEALALALADAGELDECGRVLDEWPAGSRDGIYWRLLGRWQLDHERQPEQAVESLRKALLDLPQDWRVHYRLARALQVAGRPNEARTEAEAVGRIRELLDPLTLGPKLDAAFEHLGEGTGWQSLADLCDRVGLGRLAKSWRAVGRRDGPGRSR